MMTVTYSCDLMNVGHMRLSVEPVTFTVTRDKDFASSSFIVNSVTFEVYEPGDDGLGIRQEGSGTILVNAVTGEVLLNTGDYQGPCHSWGFGLSTTADYSNLTKLKLSGPSGSWQLGSGSRCVIKVNYTPRNSSFTLTNTSIEAGARLGLTISCPDATLKHRVTLAFGSASVGWDVAAGTTSWSAATSLDLLRQIPKAKSGTGTVTLQTFDASGGVICTTYKSITITCPASVAPVIDASGTKCAPLLTVGGTAYADNGMYVARKCGVKATLAVTGALYGATLTTAVSVDGRTDSGYSKSGTGGFVFDSALLTRAGTIAVRFTAVDSRGFSAALVINLTVADYGAPVVTLDGWRTGIDGAADPRGTLCRFSASAVFTALGGKNALTLALAVFAADGTKLADGTWPTDSSGAQRLSFTNEPLKGADGAELVLNPMVTYTLCVTANDDYCCIPFTRIVPSAQFALHLGVGGDKAAFGQIAERSKVVEINPNWDLWMKGMPLLDLVYPVGCVVLGAGDACPAAGWGGGWTEIASGIAGVSAWKRVE